MGNGGGLFGMVVILAALSAIPAVLSNWQPWEVVALVAVLAIAGAAGAAVWAWYTVQARRAELAEFEALAPDEQAAQRLSGALGRCGLFLTAPAVEEVWAVFAAAPSESKRAMAIAVTGLLAETESHLMFAAGTKIQALVRSFRGPAAVATTDEQAARAFGEAVGRCVNHLDDKMAEGLWDVFVSLPGDAKRGLANTLAGFVASADMNNDNIGPTVLALARSFRDHSGASPRAGSPVPHTSPVLIT